LFTQQTSPGFRLLLVQMQLASGRTTINWIKFGLSLEKRKKQRSALTGTLRHQSFSDQPTLAVAP